MGEDKQPGWLTVDDVFELARLLSRCLDFIAEQQSSHLSRNE